MLTVFQCVTMEGWTTIMYDVSTFSIFHWLAEGEDDEDDDDGDDDDDDDDGGGDDDDDGGGGGGEKDDNECH